MSEKVNWVRAIGVDELAPGRGRVVHAGGLSLALFNDGGSFFAIDDACPHQGGPLSSGVLHDGRIICPWHSWVFDLRTGQCPRGTHEGVVTYPTRCAGGAVEIQVFGRRGE